MKLNVYTKSRTFTRYIQAVTGLDVKFYSELTNFLSEDGSVNLIHAVSFSNDLSLVLEKNKDNLHVIGIASDSPNVKDLLNYTQLGVKAFFNSFMSTKHYHQLVRLLSNGQSWFPPYLVSEAFSLARTTIDPTRDSDLFYMLTTREREIALAVVDGNTNKQIAVTCGITDRTVKAHLTQIFKKLHVKGRIGLVLYVKSA